VSRKLQRKSADKGQLNPASDGGAANAQPASKPQAGWPVPVVCVLLGLVVWIVFGQTVHFEFVNYDDQDYVYQNAAVSQGVTLKGVSWAFTHVHGGNWHPLTTLSHMLDCQLYGLNPGGHHRTNLLLHAATAIALFLVLHRISGALWRSAFVAAVFAIHPLRVESVAWISERKDVLSGLLFMLVIAAYVRFTRRTTTGRFLASPAYWLALFLFTLGLMAKPMLVTLPFILLLLDWWPLGRWRDQAPSGEGTPAFRPLASLLLEKVPFVLLSAAACAATILAQAKAQAIAPLQVVALPARLANAMVACVTYLWQMVNPSQLSVFYPHPGSQIAFWTVAMSALVLLVISMAVFLKRHRQPYLAVGWLWYLGMLVPVIGLVQVGGHAHADRYTYLPQIGLYLIVTWGMWDLCSGWRQRRQVLGTVAVSILIALLWAARLQTAHWRTSISLWTHALKSTSRNSTAHYSLGTALAKQGKFEEAIRHYELALQIQPGLSEANYNLGNALVRLGRIDESIPRFERALQLNPDYAEAHNNLGIMLMKQGKREAALAHFRQALALATRQGNTDLVTANQARLKAYQPSAQPAR
jgi:hypothetical protein